MQRLVLTLTPCCRGIDCQLRGNSGLRMIKKTFLCEELAAITLDILPVRQRITVSIVQGDRLEIRITTGEARLCR